MAFFKAESILEPNETTNKEKFVKGVLSLSKNPSLEEAERKESERKKQQKIADPSMKVHSLICPCSQVKDLLKDKQNKTCVCACPDLHGSVLNNLAQLPDPLSRTLKLGRSVNVVLKIKCQ